jgi:CubicO group peptidase (beta-lactamase class C family)
VLFRALLITGIAALPSPGLPVKSPASVGMSAKRLESIDRIVKRGVNAGGYPGAAVVVGRKGATVWEKGFGHVSWGTKAPAVKPGETIYDLASLTKVVGTTTAVMLLYDEGRIELDKPVREYLPEFSGGDKDSVTIRELLEHRSGLPADRDIWKMARNPIEARAVVMDVPLVCRPGDCYVYSDLGAIVLGLVVERVTGQGLDVYLHERVFAPLGMTHTFFRPADSLRKRVAPTSLTADGGYMVRGVVHDENAWALGGVAGHAGLFSTAGDLAVFSQMLLNGGVYDGVRIVSDSAVRLFTTRAAGSRALGWAMADGQWGSGRYLSDGSFGHVGFTGTSIWIDPTREMFVILLTNRVYKPKVRGSSKAIADIRADLADAAAVAVTDDPDQMLAMPDSYRSELRHGWNPRPPRRHHTHHATHTASAKSKTPAGKKTSAKSVSATKASAAVASTVK